MFWLLKYLILRGKFIIHTELFVLLRSFHSELPHPKQTGLVGEHILICISNFPDRRQSPRSRRSFGFVAPVLSCFPWKGPVRPPQANSQAAVLWRAREIKEPPTDPTYCLALLPSISSMPQSASYMCTSCLPGLWQSRALHLFAYA